MQRLVSMAPFRWLWYKIFQRYLLRQMFLNKLTALLLGKHYANGIQTALQALWRRLVDNVTEGCSVRPAGVYRRAMRAQTPKDNQYDLFRDTWSFPAPSTQRTVRATQCLFLPRLPGLHASHQHDMGSRCEHAST